MIVLPASDAVVIDFSIELDSSSYARGNLEFHEFNQSLIARR